MIAFVLTAPPAPFLPESAHGRLCIALALCYFGDLEEGERLIKPLRSFGRPLADVVAPTPYTAFQSGFDQTFPPGILNYWKFNYVNELTDAGIDTAVDHSARLPSPTSCAYFEHLGGAIARAGTNYTAFGHCDVMFDFSVLASLTRPRRTSPRRASSGRDAAVCDRGRLRQQPR